MRQRSSLIHRIQTTLYMFRCFLQTLTINAPTTAPLLRFLNMTATPEVAKRARLAIRERVTVFACTQIEEHFSKHPIWRSLPEQQRRKVLSAITYLKDDAEVRSRREARLCSWRVKGHV